MRTVEISLRPTELSRQMAEMRMWLDERRFEPSCFSCYDTGLSVLARIDFKVATEAEAFAERFGGHVNEALACYAEVDVSRVGLVAEGVVG